MPGVAAGKELSRSRLDSKNWNLPMSIPMELPDAEPPDPTPESLLPPCNTTIITNIEIHFQKGGNLTILFQ